MAAILLSFRGLEFRGHISLPMEVVEIFAWCWGNRTSLQGEAGSFFGPRTRHLPFLLTCSRGVHSKNLGQTVYVIALPGGGQGRPKEGAPRQWVSWSVGLVRGPVGEGWIIGSAKSSLQLPRNLDKEDEGRWGRRESAPAGVHGGCSVNGPTSGQNQP